MSRTYRLKDIKSIRGNRSDYTRQEFNFCKGYSEEIPSVNRESHRYYHLGQDEYLVRLKKNFELDKEDTYVETYEEYVKRLNAIRHTDAGYHGWGDRYYRSAPGWCCNLYAERPLRRQQKVQLKKALEQDAWDGFSIEPFIHSADRKSVV